MAAAQRTARAAAPPAAPGAPTPAVVARRVAPDALAENSQRKLVVQGGRLGLVYVTLVQGVPQVAVARATSPAGPWAAEVVTAGPAPSRLPSLAAAPDGALHLVWTRYEPLGAVYYRAARTAGWDAPVRLSRSGVYAGVPVVAPHAGGLEVLWYGIRPERPDAPTRHSSIYEILATGRAPGRAGWRPPVVISPGIPDSLNPSLDASPGRLDAAWTQFDGRAFQVRVARYAGGWSRPETVTSGSPDHVSVSLAASPEGPHLVWQEHGATPRVVYLRPGGRPQSLSGTGPAEDPVIAAAGGRVLAAWSEAGRVVVRWLRPSGAARTLGPGRAPALALDAGGAHLAWLAPGESGPEIRVVQVPLP